MRICNVGADRLLGMLRLLEGRRLSRRREEAHIMGKRETRREEAAGPAFTAPAGSEEKKPFRDVAHWYEAAETYRYGEVRVECYRGWRYDRGSDGNP